MPIDGDVNDFDIGRLLAYILSGVFGQCQFTYRVMLQGL